MPKKILSAAIFFSFCGRFVFLAEIDIAICIALHCKYAKKLHLTLQLFAGKSGGWREYFDEEMQAQAAHWIKDNLRGTDLSFPGMDDLTIE